MNWWENTIFTEKNFCELLACAAKGCHTPNFMEKTFAIATKLRNLRKFLPSKVSCCTAVDSC